MPLHIPSNIEPLDAGYNYSNKTISHPLIFNFIVVPIEYDIIKVRGFIKI